MLMKLFMILTTSLSFQLQMIDRAHLS
uniref:Uncharacterized protein n=1 Tax=Rhizophora mucronata TaxID=61149 RepID=A0A2P2LQS7_RHIMU